MQVSDEMVRVACDAYNEKCDGAYYGAAVNPMRSALTAALNAMWRPVPDWDGYEVSIDGQVRSVDRYVIGKDGVAKLYRGRVLSQKRNECKYLTVHLRAPGRNNPAMRVHRLVASAFIPNPDNKPNVNHIDCDVENNSVPNLEWCTQEENLTHMTRLGRRASAQKGKRPATALLSDMQVIEMRRQYNTGEWSLSQLAGRYKISKRAVGRVVSGETYRDVNLPPFELAAE